MTPTGDEMVRSFQRDGFAVLRGAFDPSELSQEIDDALRDGIPAGSRPMEGAGGVEFLSVVMMCERTPVSLALVDDLAELAAELWTDQCSLARRRAPTTSDRAVSTPTATPAIPSLGSVAYLEPVPASSGARGSYPARIARAETSDPSVVRTLPTDPGDLIVFDEHPDARKLRRGRSPAVARRLHCRSREPRRRSNGASDLRAPVRSGLGRRRRRGSVSELRAILADPRSPMDCAVPRPRRLRTGCPARSGAPCSSSGRIVTRRPRSPLAVLLPSGELGDDVVCGVAEQVPRAGSDRGLIVGVVQPTAVQREAATPDARRQVVANELEQLDPLVERSAPRARRAPSPQRWACASRATMRALPGSPGGTDRPAARCG